MKFLFSFLCLCLILNANAQETIFEKSAGTQTATYFETISFYKTLASKSALVKVQEMGPTDAGYPLHLVLVSNEKISSAADLHKNNKVVIMINNGIHPGEPDGVDASMMLVRDMINKKIILPKNIVLGIIPLYNIGGALNRNSTTRVNQNGPEEYGFRGNAQNLDLNRDFTKCDSYNAQSFTKILHYLNPDILIDNHVSDGADYQHTMTLIATQYDKLGPVAGPWLRDVFEPTIYKGMKEKNWDLIPYVEFDGADFDKGITQFYETPRYSSGYAALFGIFSFIPETHMLKPYKQRVQSTYDLMKIFIEQASAQSVALLATRKKATEAVAKQESFALRWTPDITKHSTIDFKGYQQDTAISAATSLPQMFYNRNKPYERKINYYDYFQPQNVVSKPKAYVLPAGWHEVRDRLLLNGVKMQELKRDTSINVNIYTIEDYKSRPSAYEKHHVNYNTKVSSSNMNLKFLKGDYIIYLNQPANRYIIEMLEPTGDDSFFSWNFFDAILQQKEGYSDYRWDELAAGVLKTNPEMSKELLQKKEADPAFARNRSAILNWIYKNSEYAEKSFMRYPVYRINN